MDSNLVRMLPVRVSNEGGEEGDGKLEWDELPDLRWPELGVRVRDPFHEERRITKTDAKKDLDVFDEELLVEEE